MFNWIEIDNQLPPDNEKLGGKPYIVTVVCDTWDKPETMIMSWECRTIKKREVKRWLWNDRVKVDGWNVTHWMELPPPVVSK